MHRKQAGSLFHGEVPVGSRFYVKMRHARVLFIEEIQLLRNICAIYIHIGLFVPANYFHMHPSMQPRLGTETFDLF